MARILRVVVADDHPVVCDGLQAALSGLPDVQVVGTASTWDAVSATIADTAPDVLLLDLHMPGGAGSDAISSIHASSPDVAILVFTMDGEDASLGGAFRAGAKGYLPKGAGHREIIAALRAVAQGSIVFGAAAVPMITRLLAARAAPRSDKRLMVVLFTDIVASTACVYELGDRRWRALLERHDGLTKAHVHAQGGWYVKSTGDGCLAVFDTPSGAIAAARAVVREAQGLGLVVRAGLHAGECQVGSEDVHGVAVHVAARVTALAEGGDVVATRTVTELIAGSGAAFQTRGQRPLTGLPGVWELYSCNAMTAEGREEVLV
jgi:DNA-binding NarL/FixJ family response regulator